MTFNIRFDNPNDGKNIWENRKTEVLELIKYYHPGFFGLQEAMNNQLEFINDGLKDYAFIGVGREDGKQKGEYTPIFFDSTSFQLISHHTFWLSETADEVSVGWDAALERICTYGLFMDKETGDSIHVFNTHFDHMGKVARLMSAKLIEQKIDGVASGSSFIILMGDLNCTPESEPFQVLQEELDYGAEISLKGLYGPDGTFNGYVEDLVMTERIDHIFTRNFKVNSYRHIDDRMKNNGYLSDHLPVIAEIEVK
ncbi:MAG: endonuclease/exonuclease/phosphatase family protein [Bacteroidales bacterium]|nr:endonuclease/exonuclease/phosphatase family protein [Bacteroidales bacterium]